MSASRRSYRKQTKYVLHEYIPNVIQQSQFVPESQPTVPVNHIPKTLSGVGTVYKNNIFDWEVLQTDLINSKENFITFHGTSTLVVNGLSDTDISRIDIKSNLYGLSYKVDLADVSITNESPFEPYRPEVKNYDIVQENVLHSSNNLVFLVIPGGTELNFIQSSCKKHTNISNDKMEYWYKLFQVPKLYVKFKPIMFKWNPDTKVLHLIQHLDISVPSYTNTQNILDKNFLKMFEHSCFVNII